MSGWIKDGQMDRDVLREIEPNINCRMFMACLCLWAIRFFHLYCMLKKIIIKCWGKYLFQAGKLRGWGTGVGGRFVFTEYSLHLLNFYSLFIACTCSTCSKINRYKSKRWSRTLKVINCYAYFTDICIQWTFIDGLQQAPC